MIGLKNKLSEKMLVKDRRPVIAVLLLCLNALEFQSTMFTASLSLIMLYLIFTKKPIPFKRESVSRVLPAAIIAAVMTVLAQSYYLKDDWSLVIGSAGALTISLLKLLGDTAAYALLLSIPEEWSLSKCPLTEEKGRDRRILKLTLLLFCLWIPYMIIFYPGCMNPDARDQLAQVLGARDFCWTIKTIRLISPEVILNNYHPIFHTLILGVFAHLGLAFGSLPLGLELYCIIQSAILAFTLAAQVDYLARHCGSKTFVRGACLFFGLNPLIPIWGMTITKDVYFTILLWWILLLLYKVLCRTEEAKKRDYLLLILLLILWMLMRNNGFYVLAVLIFPIVIYLRWKKEKAGRILLVLLTAMLFFQVGVQGILMPAFKITPGSPREMLSVPFMQTARYLTEYPEDFSEEDLVLLEKIFIPAEDKTLIETVSEKYLETPDRADGVKNLFTAESDPDLLPDYFKLWGKGLLRRPTVYVQAFFALDAGWIGWDNDQDMIFYKGICDDWMTHFREELVNPESTRWIRDGIYRFVRSLANYPLLSILIKLAVYTWSAFYLTYILIRRRRFGELLAVGPVIVNLLICFIGPVAYMRYAMPIMICLPTMVLYTFAEKESYSVYGRCSSE